MTPTEVINLLRIVWTYLMSIGVNITDKEFWDKTEIVIKNISLFMEKTNNELEKFGGNEIKEKNIKVESKDDYIYGDGELDSFFFEDLNGVPPGVMNMEYHMPAGAKPAGSTKSAPKSGDLQRSVDPKRKRFSELQEKRAAQLKNFTDISRFGCNFDYNT